MTEVRFDFHLGISARKRSLAQGNIFRSLCQEFCPRGTGGFCLSACWYTTPPMSRHPPGTRLPGTRHPPRSRHPPPRTRPSLPCWEIWSTSGRYASYWNVILFFDECQGKVQSYLLCVLVFYSD